MPPSLPCRSRTHLRVLRGCPRPVARLDGSGKRITSPRARCPPPRLNGRACKVPDATNGSATCVPPGGRTGRVKRRDIRRDRVMRGGRARRRRALRPPVGVVAGSEWRRASHGIEPASAADPRREMTLLIRQAAPLSCPWLKCGAVVVSGDIGGRYCCWSISSVSMASRKSDANCPKSMLARSAGPRSTILGTILWPVVCCTYVGLLHSRLNNAILTQHRCRTSSVAQVGVRSLSVDARGTACVHHGSTAGTISCTMR